MKKLPLQSGGEMFLLSTNGTLANTVTTIGRWSTNADNDIQLIPDTGPATTVKVTWRFNESNQLCAFQGTTKVFTLSGNDVAPRYRLEKNVLMVDPDGDADFEFPLQCVWGFTAEGNLQVTIGDQESVLDGFIEDSRSRLRFRFLDMERPIATSSLVFSGEWERLTKTAEDKEKIVLHFRLEDPRLEDKDAPLNLPGEVKVDPLRNHLVFNYQSPNFGLRKIEFHGSLQIKQNFTLVFTIQDSKDAVTGVRKSRIEVATTFDFEKFQGGLQLHVAHTKGQTLEIGGTLSAKIGPAGLKLDFAYLKDVSGAKPVVALAVGATFNFENGAIMISYKQAGRSFEFDVTAKLVTEDFVVSGGVTIKNDPTGRRLGGFIGIRF
jgi:hypothetical protein